MYFVAVGVTLVLEKRNSKQKLVYMRDLYSNAINRRNRRSNGKRDADDSKRRRRRSGAAEELKEEVTRDRLTVPGENHLDHGDLL